MSFLEKYIKGTKLNSVFGKKDKTEMLNYEYLNQLIDTVKNIREKVVFQEIDISQCTISYMATKKTSFVGYREGYSDCLIQSQKSMKKSNKLHAATKDYLKYIKNKDEDLVRIECYIKGKLDCLFQVYREENIRYLVPFSAKGGFYPTYVYITKYEGNRVVEEYMVEGNQIIYELYIYRSDNDVDYEYINYVSGGKYPVLERRKGVFQIMPLTYRESYSDNWLNS